jgi:hypothetical protein
MPLLIKNKAHILESKPATHSFGPLSRHKLDVYSAKSGGAGSKPPVLFFFYGGESMVAVP